MFNLVHFDAMPLIYGLLMFFGIWVMWLKLARLKFFELFVSAGVFYLVFSLHGGTMAGGFSAMICALLFDLFVFPPWRKKK